MAAILIGRGGVEEGRRERGASERTDGGPEGRRDGGREGRIQRMSKRERRVFSLAARWICRLTIWTKVNRQTVRI